jgi:hypothetical protein
LPRLAAGLASSSVFEWGLPLDSKPGEKADGLEFSIGGLF